MLPTKNRLSKTKDIQKTFTRGRGFFYPLFGVKFEAGLPPSRFTVVVSTKISKSAVKRNKIKRVMREVLRKNIPLLKDGNYLVLARPPAVKASAQELKDGFLQGLKSAKLLN